MSTENFKNITIRPSENSKYSSQEIAENSIKNLIMVIILLILFIVLTIIEILIIALFLWMKNPE